MNGVIRRRFIPDVHERDSKGFRMRGTQVSRLEGISDAVFGLAITLIVVSLKAPESFQQLMSTLQGFVGSGVCVLFMMQIWNRHFLYFRRYGIEDGITRLLNGILLFVVIAYVYPLKFLFGAFFDSLFHFHVTQTSMNWDELPKLFIVFGAGFTLVYLLFGLMYGHALRQRKELDLNELEALQTRWTMGEHFLMAAAGMLSMLVALLGGPSTAMYAGFAYFVIPFFLTVHGSRHGDALRRLNSELGANGTEEPTEAPGQR